MSQAGALSRPFSGSHRPLPRLRARRSRLARAVSGCSGLFRSSLEATLLDVEPFSRLKSRVVKNLAAGVRAAFP